MILKKSTIYEPWLQGGYEKQEERDKSPWDRCREQREQRGGRRSNKARLLTDSPKQSERQAEETSLWFSRILTDDDGGPLEGGGTEWVDDGGVGGDGWGIFCQSH